MPNSHMSPSPAAPVSPLCWLLPTHPHPLSPSRSVYLLLSHSFPFLLQPNESHKPRILCLLPSPPFYYIFSFALNSTFLFHPWGERLGMYIFPGPPLPATSQLLPHREALKSNK